MSKINTDETREQIDEKWKQGAVAWFRTELRQALDEIDRLRREQGKVRSELAKWQVEQIEQRTKEACKAALWEVKTHKPIVGFGAYLIRRDHALQAIDSAGGK